METEQPNFIYFECQECGFDSIQRKEFNGSRECPLCAFKYRVLFSGDSGHSNIMSVRIARVTDKPEGRDARLEQK